MVTVGHLDQDALIPFAPETSQTVEFTYDDIQFTTAVALLNPSDQQTTVTITAFGDDGDQVGTTQLALAPHTKSANVLAVMRGWRVFSANKAESSSQCPMGPCQYSRCDSAGRGLATSRSTIDDGA